MKMQESIEKTLVQTSCLPRGEFTISISEHSNFMLPMFELRRGNFVNLCKIGGKQLEIPTKDDEGNNYKFIYFIRKKVMGRTNNNYLTGGWKDFLKKRGIKEGDRVMLKWDPDRFLLIVTAQLARRHPLHFLLNFPRKCRTESDTSKVERILCNLKHDVLEEARGKQMVVATPQRKFGRISLSGSFSISRDLQTGGFRVSLAGAHTDFLRMLMTNSPVEDVAKRIIDSSKQGVRTISFVSANGLVCNLRLRKPENSEEAEGQFEIITPTPTLLAEPTVQELASGKEGLGKD